MPERLDRMESMLDRLISSQLRQDDQIYDLQATVDKNFRRVYNNIERIYDNMERVLDDIKIMQSEIRGLQIENQRILEELRDRREGE
jgi:DNA-binding transcriptional regulator WhiA